MGSEADGRARINGVSQLEQEVLAVLIRSDRCWVVWKQRISVHLMVFEIEIAAQFFPFPSDSEAGVNSAKRSAGRGRVNVERSRRRSGNHVDDAAERVGSI